MKVFMIGGTGLLGSEAAKCLIEKGHDVKTLSLPSLPKGAEFPEEMKIVFGDINKMTDAELKHSSRVQMSLFLPRVLTKELSALHR